MTRALDPGDLPVVPLGERIVADLTTRGALGGLLTALYVVGVAVGWIVYVRWVKARVRAVPLRILVTGSRGKSSTVRLLHAALTSQGMRVSAKTTGTAAREIDPSGVESTTRRFGQVSVLEMLPALHRATKAKPDAVVFECMAVQPQFISLLGHDMVQSTHAVVTNALLDHLEEEGNSAVSVMQSLARAVPGTEVTVTAERDPDALWELARECNACDVPLVVAPENDSSVEDLPHIFPANASVALTVVRTIGGDVAVAREALLNATREPGDREVLSARWKNLTLHWADIGSTNDPASAIYAVRQVLQGINPDIPVILLLASRSDRPLRALEFAGLLSEVSCSGVFVTGGADIAVARVLRACGHDPKSIRILGQFVSLPWFTGALLTRAIHRAVPDSKEVAIIAMENVHDSVVDRIRAFVHRNRVPSEGEL